MATKKRPKAGTSHHEAAQKRKKFVEDYLANGGNATQAAISAGYSEKSAGVTGSKLLKDAKVLAEISKRRVEIVANAELSTDRLVKEIGRISFSDPRKIINDKGQVKLPHELDEETAAAISSFKMNADGSIEYRFWDKNSAHERACKITGAFEKDNTQSRPVTKVVIVPPKQERNAGGE